tara:strand:+ start:163 stop:285 length:123 start_codon:yes stop_codon:yes gene_type:complete
MAIPFLLNNMKSKFIIAKLKPIRKNKRARLKAENGLILVV